MGVRVSAKNAKGKGTAGDTSACSSVNSNVKPKQTLSNKRISPVDYL